MLLAFQDSSSEVASKTSPAWQKHIGTSKSSLAGLVKPKSTMSGLVRPKSNLPGLVKYKSALSGLVKTKPATEKGNSKVETPNVNQNPDKDTDKSIEKSTEVRFAEKDCMATMDKNSEAKTEVEDVNRKTEKAKGSTPSLGGLGLLGNYSDTSSESE